MNKNNNRQNKDQNEFVNNKESFNNRIFERNMLSSQLAGNRNKNPLYFSEEYSTNRTKATDIFDKRFQDNIYNQNLAPKAGFVDFRDKNENYNSDIKFSNNFKKYINQ